MWTPESLKFGAFFAPYHPLNADPTLQIRRDLDLFEFLDHLGYSEGWMGEHHSTGSETIAAPDQFLAAAAERTHRMRLGTGVMSLPYQHPLLAADRLLQLDHQSRGRAIFGTGPGKLPVDAHMMGIDTQEQRRMQGEALEAILPLLRGEVVNMETDWFVLRDGRCQLRPYSHEGLEVVTASTVSPSGSVLAGKNGLSMLSLAASSPAGFDALDRNWEIYEEVSAENGFATDRATWRLVSPIFLADSRADAEKAVERRIPELVRYLLTLGGQNAAPPEWARSVPKIIDQWRNDTLGEWGTGIIGTPDEAIEQIERLVEKTGGFGTLLLLDCDIMSWEDTKRSYELFASEVVPHFKRANVNREATLKYHGDNADDLMGKWVAAVQKATDEYEGQPASV